MNIAMVSEHANPLAAIGGVDAGGQNVHVAELSRALAGRGHWVTVYTRHDAPGLPRRVRLRPRLQVVHVPAGPPSEVPKDELLPYMPDFAEFLRSQWSTRLPDIVHAHFWMSGFAALLAAPDCGVPVVASAVGGLTDTVVDQVTGELVRSPTSAELAGVQRSLLADPFRLGAYRTSGMDRARSRYPWARIAADTEAAYERARAGAAGAASAAEHVDETLEAAR